MHAHKLRAPLSQQHCHSLPATAFQCHKHTRNGFRDILSAKLESTGLCASSASTQLPATVWTDEYSDLADRVDAPPLPLPSLIAPKRIVIVRHGQSTWNAESRVQGSSNLSVLTAKGVRQAEATKLMLKHEHFDYLFASPLERASRTADIVWNGRPAPRTELPLLREIDLYSFQGLTKAEVKATFGPQYHQWHHQPTEFLLDNHYPVREMWHRGSLAWQRILTTPPHVASVLVVAHNNTNQALIATALGLPCTYFRRLVQNNAAMSVLQLHPGEAPGTPTQAVLECLNQSSSGSPFKADDKVLGRVALLVAAEETGGQLTMAQLMSHVQVDAVFCGSRNIDHLNLSHITEVQLLAGHAKPEVQDLGCPDDAAAARTCWQGILQRASQAAGTTVAVVADAAAASALVCCALGLSLDCGRLFRFTPGGITLLEFNGAPLTTPATARCINSIAHHFSS